VNDKGKGYRARNAALKNPDLKQPSIADVESAREKIRPWLPRTASGSYPELSALTGTELIVKHENHQPTGAFKVRGGINLLSRLSEEDRLRGVISASTGNHGQSIAYAARLFQTRAIITVPEGANPSKVDSMRALGAEVVFHGENFDDAREEVERRSAAEGLRYIHSANEPLLIAGVATCTLEIIEEQPDLDALIVPIGGGTGAAGAGLVLESMSPKTELIGVQAEEAPAACLSWQQGNLVEAPMATKAEGLATRCAFELTQDLLRRHLDDFVLVSEEEMNEAVRILIKKTRNLAEPSGAAALAAALKLRDRLAGKKTAVMFSGGNISTAQLREILSAT